MKASVCIPVWNEERTIGRMLESVFTQRWDGELEVLVCANGCTDGTAVAVRRAAGSRPVRLIEVPERGKPAAWNLLFETASHDLQFFADGDVQVHPDAFVRLARRLDREPGLAALGALSVPVTTRADWLTRAVNPPLPDHASLVGRLYALRRPAVRAGLARAGFAGIPRDILHEDLWLTVLVGPSGWATDTDALVHCQPYHWSDLLRIERRSVRAERQVLRDLGSRIARHRDARLFLNEPVRRRWARRLDRLRRIRGSSDVLALAVNFLVKRAVRLVADVQVRREALRVGVAGWERAVSSKQGH